MANFCSECGVSVASSASFCSNCGNRLDKDQQPSGEKVLGAPAIGASARTIPANSNGRLKEPSLTSQEMKSLGGGNQNSKTRQFLDDVGGMWGSWRALFAILIFLFFVGGVLVVSQDKPGESLAQELCDTSIVFGPPPATMAGRDAWQRFEEKGAELLEMESAGDFRYIGALSVQLASATRAEVRLGGGKASIDGHWSDVANDSWQRTANAWAELCLALY